MQLKPFEMQDTILSTTFFPPPSVLRKGLWEIAPNQSVSTAPKKVAHIFDSLAVNDASGQHPSLGIIPLQPDQPEYPHKRYWRLRYTTLDWILSAVTLRSFLLSTQPTTDELKMVTLIYATLLGIHSGGPRGDAGDARPSGEAQPSEAASSGNAGGAGPSGEAEPGEAASSGNTGGAGPSGEAKPSEAASSGNAGGAGPSGEAEPSEAASSGNAGGAGPSGEGHGEDEGSEGGREATRGRTRKGKGRQGA